MITKINGVWRAPRAIPVKVSGVWRPVQRGLTKVAGVWKVFYQAYVSLLFKARCLSSNGQTNSFHYELISNTSLTVASGDVLYYDVYLPADGTTSSTGLDCRFTLNLMTYYMRDFTNGGKGIADQNNVRCHPATGLLPYAQGKWYRRSMALEPMVGASINSWAVAFEDDTTANQIKQAYYRDIKILDKTGAVKATIFFNAIGVTAQSTAWGSSNNYDTVSKTVVASPL